MRKFNYSSSAEQIVTFDLGFKVVHLSLFGFELLSQRLDLCDNSGLLRRGEHTALDITLLEAVVGFFQLLLHFSDK